MKKFINDPYDVVDEMLEGFLNVHQKYVRKLDKARTLVDELHERGHSATSIIGRIRENAADVEDGEVVVTGGPLSI